MKYKKLDNLDDLRVGDVIVDTEVNNILGEVVRVDGELIFIINRNIEFAKILTREGCKRYNYAAKRPLPEKKVKAWKPQGKEIYYIASPLARDLFETNVWENDNADKTWLERGLLFKTYNEAKEAALKMIKAINPNYNE